MKKLIFLLCLLTVLGASGCAVIGGIFKAGAVVGVLAVVVVIVIIIWLLSLFKGK